MRTVTASVAGHERLDGTTYAEPVSRVWYVRSRPTTTTIGIGPGPGGPDEAGRHVLSMTYPRPDYGILQVDKAMPQEVRLNNRSPMSSR